MHRRPVGLDLNGWRDFGCRDWSAEDPDAPPGSASGIDGGIRSVIVEHNDLLVGGPQAILSPIGRGKGWSDVGDTSKRRYLADHWSDLLAGRVRPWFDGDMRAAVRDLSRLADQRIVCMPDHAGMGEAQQKCLLGAITAPREPPAMLLWRSVALVLGVLDGGDIPNAADGMRIACLIHGAEGLERQFLVLRQLTDHPAMLAPERAGPGEICCPELGLAHLLTRAAAAVDAANPSLRDRPTETPRMAADLLFSDAPLHDEEIVRRDNSNWLKLRTPHDFAAEAVMEDVPKVSVDADCVVLLSPLALHHQGRLSEVLAASLNGRHPVVAAPDTTARGALYAARRIERGIPHYLDRLDQISLIAMRGHEPVFEDLIRANATVPGNREYVSPPITTMVWTAGMEEVQFYIRKGTTAIRRWKAKAQIAPERNQPLEIHLRQMPAQGWATLSITSTVWDMLRRTPIHLDWGSLEIDPRSEAEILAALERPRPVVPERVWYRSTIGLWDGTLRRYRGLCAELKSLDTSRGNNIRGFAVAIGASVRDEQRRPMYSVSTDGDFPAELGDDWRRAFTDAIGQIGAALVRDVTRTTPAPSNNDALLCLTWVFALCPRDVQEVLMAALDAILSGNLHPFLVPRGGRRVVVHGLGRVVTDPVLLRHLIPKLYSNLDRPDFLAALSSILARPTATPEVLTEEDVEAIGRKVLTILRTIIAMRRFGIDFKYALFAIAGLLRRRQCNPWALLKEQSDLARQLVEVLSDAHAAIKSMPGAIRNENEKLGTTRELIEMLSGTGGRPDILTVIDQMSDE